MDQGPRDHRWRTSSRSGTLGRTNEPEVSGRRIVVEKRSPESGSRQMKRGGYTVSCLTSRTVGFTLGRGSCLYRVVCVVTKRDLILGKRYFKSVDDGQILNHILYFK